jgi:hypothetical protein
MNPDIVPKFYRRLMWVVSLCAIMFVVLTGFIAVQMTVMDKEVDQLTASVASLIKK